MSKEIRSKERTDFLGNKYVRHEDEHGNVIGYSEERTDFFGNEYVHHEDKHGNVIGRSEERTDFFGNEYVHHEDERGNVIGRSEERTDFFGNEYVHHEDERGNVIGRSEERTDFFGNEYVHYEDKSGNAMGRDRASARDEDESSLLQVLAILGGAILGLVPVLLRLIVTMPFWVPYVGALLSMLSGHIVESLPHLLIHTFLLLRCRKREGKWRYLPVIISGVLYILVFISMGTMYVSTPSIRLP